MKYDFDRIIDRRGTDSSKWDGFEDRFPNVNVKGAIPMWVADMDFQAPKEVIDALVEKASFGIYGYPTPPGEKYKGALVHWIGKRHDWNIKEEWIVPTQGIVPAVTYAVQAFTNEGDGVIIQPPVYYPFRNRCIQYNNRKVVENPLLFDGKDYTMDYHDLEEKAKDPNNKLLILCSPHNPVGRVWKEEELKKVIEICEKYNVLIFSDEIHSDLILHNNKHIPVGKLGGSDILITAYAPTKTFNLAGLKASAIVIENKSLRNQFKRILDKNEVGGFNIFAETAFVTAYTEGEEYLEQLKEYLSENFNYLESFVKENIKEANVIHTEGTYLAWIDYNKVKKAGSNGKEIEKYVTEQSLVAGDLGSWFGEQGAGFIRYNLACPRATLKEALERLKKALE